MAQGNPNPSPKTRWKKGQSGNPSGRHAMAPEVRNLQKLSAKEFERATKVLLNADQKELERILAAEDEPYILKMIVSIMFKTTETGSMSQMDLLLNRLIGKVKDRVEHEIKKPSILVKRDGTQVLFTETKSLPPGEGEEE